MLDQVDTRFLKELDVVVLIEKLRDSYDLLSKMQSKKQLNFLQFNRNRVIDPTFYPSSSSGSSSDISSSDSEGLKDKNIK